MRTMGEYLLETFGVKVRKIAVNAGLGCPNRDGSLGTQGCVYCNNAAFNPGYAFNSSESITTQLEKGIRFNSAKGEATGYLAYFQSFSNTYGPTDHLIDLYEEALAYPGVLGLDLATRPDCLAPDLLDYFERRFGRLAPEGHPYLLVELGVESTLDRTLELINRGHDYACAEAAVKELDRRGIAVGVHLILGLPGESASDYLRHVHEISKLPVTTLKFHQLQIVKNTPLEHLYAENPDFVHLFSAEEYAETLARLLPELRPDIVLDRFVSESPSDILKAPRWWIKPGAFNDILQEKIKSLSSDS